MRVLFWSELFWPYIGGAERFLVSLASALRARGCECLVVTSHHDRDLPDEDALDGMPVHRLPFRAAFAAGRVTDFAALTQRTLRLRRAFGADLIHLNAVGPSAWFLLRTARADGAPLLVTLQQEVLTSQQGTSASLLEQALDAAQWVAACSPTVLRQVRALRPAIAARSSCIYNGIVMPEEPPLPLPDTPHVLSVGRLVPAKGVDIAIRAVARLTHRFPDLRFTVAGDGTEREPLQRLARDLGVSDRVVFTGWIEPDALPSVLNRATVVVMPSRREGLPLVAVEAASMARPVIATRAGGLADLIVDGDTGLFVDGDDPEMWASAIARVIENRALASAMGARARARVQSLADWTSVVDAYHGVYRSLTAGASKRERV